VGRISKTSLKMWPFKNEKTEVSGKALSNSDEYDRLLKRISENTNDITTIGATLKILQTDLADLRGKINSYLSKIRARADEVKKEEQQQEEYGSEIPVG